MRFVDEYRDPSVVLRLRDAVHTRASQLPGPVTIMEVCGSHTWAVGRHGIRAMLPENVKLVSGPGCPVCVTPARDIDAALFLASLPRVVFATFGDMIRVPGTGGRSLQRIRAYGADIRIISSASECLCLALDYPDREVVFMGVGFETTSPTTASMVKTLRDRGIGNVSVFPSHKLIPPAMAALLEDPDLSVHGFLCPGHVSTVLGAGAYAGIPLRGRGAVIAGFEPVDILLGIYMILGQIIRGRFSVEIQYTRGVSTRGNPKAFSLMNEVFEPADSLWRGLGPIPASGLAFREEYRMFDAEDRFEIPELSSRDPEGCRCGEVLKGKIDPGACPLFGTECTPEGPVGPCMVSHEGTCAAFYACG